MELVKLKMAKKYKFILAIIVILLIISIAIGILSFYYEKVDTDSDIEIYDNLTINFIDNKSVSVSESDTISFSITNTSDEVAYFNVAFLLVRGEGTYILRNEGTIVASGTFSSSNEINTDDISIDANTTISYTLEVANTSDSTLTFNISLRNLGEKTTTFASLILENVAVSSASLTKTGDEVATENEGLIKSYDDNGVSYYFRGNVTNNYVYFGGLTWRIVRINGDGTVRIVLDDVADTVSSYYSSDTTDYSFANSNIYNYLNEWYITNLSDYAEYIATSKFCSDVISDENYNYNAYTRIITNKIPTLNCLGSSVSTKIGLLSADEVVLAGATTENDNSSFYIYNTNITSEWYTMTAATGTENSLNLFMVTSNGKLSTSTNGNLYRGVRPVINLIKNIEMTGDGTKDNPYQIKSL